MKTFRNMWRRLDVVLCAVLLLTIVVTVVASSEPALAIAITSADRAGAPDEQLAAPASPGVTASLNPDPPAEVVKLVFIHHSSGDNWLSDGNGGLGAALGQNNYYVSDTYYGWGPDNIGSYTDIGNWWSWFRGSKSSTYLSALYGTTNRYSSYTRPMADPGGENEVVMLKSCYPNSDLKGNPGDPPTTGDNPLRGQDSGSPDHTIGNAKGIYNDILEYFGTRQDKLFVVITAPPRQDATYAANARAFNNWLVNDWLDGYPYHNVAVFDFYNVLTTNGGDPNTNDYGWSTGNHHRVVTSTMSVSIDHITDGDDDASPNVLEYPTGDDHPSAAGNRKATGEFVPVLNAYYNCWKHGQCSGLTGWISVQADPVVTSVNPGGTGVYTLSLTTGAGSVPPVSLALQGAPDGATVTFDPDSLAPPGVSRLQVATDPSTGDGIYPMTVIGDAGVLSDTATLDLIVASAAPSFAFDVSPSAWVAAPGQTASCTVSVTGIGGFSQPVDLTVVGLPAGVVPAWTVDPVLPGGSSMLTLSLSESAPYGGYGVYVVGTAGTLVVASELWLSIEYPFKTYLPVVLRVYP